MEQANGHAEDVKGAVNQLDDVVLAELLEVAQFALNDVDTIRRVAAELWLSTARVGAFFGLAVELSNANGEPPSIRTEAELSAQEQTLAALEADSAIDAEDESLSPGREDETGRSATPLQTAENWFWVLNASEDRWPVDVERVVAWTNTDEGWIGLISPEMNGSVLQEPPPFAGGKYKHLNDLTPLELEALEHKKRDPEQRQ